MEILEHEVYTTEETLSLLKISKSTFLRLVKKGLISAYKVGGQYRILGRELLEMFNPKVRNTAEKAYKKVRNGVKRRLEKIED